MPKATYEFGHGPKIHMTTPEEVEADDKGRTFWLFEVDDAHGDHPPVPFRFADGDIETVCRQLRNSLYNLISSNAIDQQYPQIFEMIRQLNSSRPPLTE